MTPSQPAGIYRGPTAGPAFWNPRSGIFDRGQLRLAIISRGWTVVEFAHAAKISPACLYNALNGRGVTDRTAIKVFQGLAQRQAVIPLL